MAEDHVPAGRGRLAGVAIGVAAAAFALPFLVPVHAPPILSFHDEWIGVALLLVAALLAAASRGLRWTLPAHVPWLLAAAIAFALHAPGAVYPQLPLAATAYVFVLVIAAMTACALAAGGQRGEAVRAFAAASLVAAVANVAIALVQLHGVPASLTPLIGASAPGRAVGHVGQANLLATFLAIGLAGALCLHALRALGGIAFAAIALAIAYGLALSGSRLALAHVLWIVLAAAVGHRALLGAALGAAAMVLVLQFAVAPLHASLGWPVPASGVDRAQALAAIDAHALGLGTRLALWREAIALGAQTPWIGAGPGFLAADLFARGLPDALAREGEVWSSAHNLFVDAFVAGGLAALVALIAAAALWWLPRVRALARGADPPLLWSVLVVGLIGLHALVETAHLYAHMLVIAGLAIGIGDAGDARQERPGGALRAGVAVLAAALAVVALRVLLDHHSLDRVRFSQQATFLDERARADDARTLVALADGPLAPVAELTRFLGLPVRAADAADCAALGARVVQFRPATVVVARQAACLALAGFDDQADALVDHLIAQRPWARGAVVAVLDAAEEGAAAPIAALRQRVLVNASSIPR